MKTTLLADIVTAKDWNPTAHDSHKHGIKHWHETSRRRHHLAHEEVGTLRDVGARPIEERREARRWFWDDPMF